MTWSFLGEANNHSKFALDLFNHFPVLDGFKVNFASNKSFNFLYEE